jgi:hypothetical protein
MAVVTSVEDPDFFLSVYNFTNRLGLNPDPDPYPSPYNFWTNFFQYEI